MSDRRYNWRYTSYGYKSFTTVNGLANIRVPSKGREYIHDSGRESLIQNAGAECFGLQICFGYWIFSGMGPPSLNTISIHIQNIV